MNTNATHDPGGKSRLSLPPDVLGDAVFSPCGRYRHALSRDWGRGRSVLFVGLNPSVAGGDISDPTCHRELCFARDWGFTRYLKGNVLDWRATSPKDIPGDPNLARSPENLRIVVEMAIEAETIVMASGNVHPRYADLEAETLDALRSLDKPLMCLGHNKSGAAKHPLYIRKDAPLIRY